jgi:hypothetical protein
MKVGDLVRLRGFPPLGGGPQNTGCLGIVTRYSDMGSWVLVNGNHLQYANGSLEVINESR